MSGASEALSQRNARKVNGVDLKLAAADRRGHDIDDGIGGADLVEMNSVGGYAVNLSFRLGKTGEDFVARLLHVRMKFAAVDETLNLFPGTLGFLVGTDDPKASRP